MIGKIILSVLGFGLAISSASAMPVANQMMNKKQLRKVNVKEVQEMQKKQCESLKNVTARQYCLKKLNGTNNKAVQKVVANKLQAVTNTKIGIAKDAKKEFRKQTREAVVFKNKNKKEVSEFRKNVQSEIQNTRKQVAEKRAIYQKQLKEATSDEERAKIKAQIEADKEALKQKIEERRKELFSKSKEFLTKKFQIVEKRFEAYIEKAQQINGRINKRLEILVSEGKDISGIKDLQEKVNTYISTVKQDLDAFRAINKEALETSNRKELVSVLKKGRENINAARKNIKLAFQTIREMVQKMKALK